MDIQPKPISNDGLLSSMYRVKVNLSNPTAEIKSQVNWFEHRFSENCVLVTTNVQIFLNRSIGTLDAIEREEVIPFSLRFSLRFQPWTSIKGYGTIPIQREFDIPQAKMIFKRLATFHAICAVLQEEQPNIFDNIRNKIGGKILILYIYCESKGILHV